VVSGEKNSFTLSTDCPNFAGMTLKKEIIKPVGLFVVILALVTYGSLGSGEEAGKINKVLQFPNSDKLIHGIMYFLLTGSLIYLLIKRFRTFKNWKLYVIVLASPILYGLLMEALQFWLTSNRQAEVGDFIANTAGTVTAFIAALAHENLKNTYQSKL